MRSIAPGGGPTPLTKRLGPKHWAALDYAAGGFTTLILFLEVRRGLARENFPLGFGVMHYWPMPLAGPVAVLLVMAAGFAVALRRRKPVVMLGVLLVGSFLISTLTVPDASALTYFLPVAYVLYLVAATFETKRDAVRVLVAVCLTLVAVAIVLVYGSGGNFNGSSLIPVVLCVIIAWTSGYSVRQRRRYAVRLQDEAASKAVAQERLRIARELHDVVAHSMSVIAVQAGYGQYVIDSQPGDARAALGAIQTTSREALDEMRRMLGALRQADDADARGDGAGLAPAGSGLPARLAAPGGGASAPLFPAPGLAELDRLVARTAGAGVRVDVTRFGRPRDLPASIDLSAYRIVQEALTNVVKHARTSSCRVLLGYRDDELTIEVTDNGAGLAGAGLAGPGLAGPGLAGPGLARHGSAVANGAALMSRNGTSPHGVGVLDGVGVGVLDGAPAPPDDDPAPGASLPGAGHGIIGMRERVTLLGGEFSAGPLPGYGFRVSARIPLPAASA